MNGAVALVTGGAKRVGRAIALELAGAGCDVAIHYRRSQGEAEKVAEQVRAMGRKAALIPADLDDPSAWRRIVADTLTALGRLDILVNNASAFLTDEPDTLEAFDVGRFETMLRTNLVAPVGLCHHARPFLRASDVGVVINLLDAGWERPWPDHLAYGASKAGLAAVTRGLARSLAPDVRVCGVAPGIAVFPDSYDETTRRKLTDRVPLRRAGTVSDIARLVRFLVESGEYVTGEIIRVDGGRHLV